MSATYRTERIKGGSITGLSDGTATLAEAVAWAVSCGDGEYASGPEKRSPWASEPYVDFDSPETLSFAVRGGAVVVPARTDWAHLVRGSDRARCQSLSPLPPRATAWVVKPGPFSRLGLLRVPGICLSRGPLPGDEILDTLTIETTESGLEVTSATHGEESPLESDRSFFKVSLGGRASGWGGLGDDGYDPGTADAILADVLLELVLGAGEWKIAPVYWDCTCVSGRPEGRHSKPLVTVDLSDFRAEEFRAKHFADRNREYDTRPATLFAEISDDPEKRGRIR